VVGGLDSAVTGATLAAHCRSGTGRDFAHVWSFTFRRYRRGGLEA